MNTKIIQLQEEGGNCFTNGSWSNKTNIEYFLEEGDEISIKQAFIDTSDLILIEEDTTVSVDFSPYFVNHDEVKAPNAQNKVLREYEKTPATTQPDNKLYVACNITPPPGGGAKYTFVESYRVYGFFGNVVTEDRLFKIELSYMPVDGTARKTWGPFRPPILETRFVKRGADIFYYDAIVQINILAVQNTIIDKSSVYQKLEPIFKKNPFHGINSSSEVDAHEAYTPLILTEEVLIPQGSYSPNDLSHLITTKINKINTNKSQLDPVLLSDPIDNKLFSTTSQQNGFAKVTRCNYVAIDGSDICKFADGSPNRFMGAENFSIEYGDSNGIDKFLISNMHSPIYNSAIPGIKLQQPGLGGDSVNIIGVSNGILLNALRPTSFWYDKLGFSSDCLFVPQHKQVQIANIPRFVINIGPNDSLDSIITQAYCGLDYLVNKTIAAGSAGYIKGDAYDVPSGVLDTFISSNEVQPIFAQNSMALQQQQANPYYLININCMRNELTGNEKLTTLSCVTGNYYGVGSYVLSQPSDSVPYIHQGLPVSLSNFKVDILSKDGDHPVIGRKSHVFLELNKNPQSQKKQSSKK